MVGVTWLLLAMLAAGVLGFVRRPTRADVPGLLGLVALTAIGAWLRFRFVPFHHAMYVDEPWYQESARNVLQGRGLVICDPECAPYIKSAGWPAILTLPFAIFGSTDHTAFVTSAVFGVAAIPAAAFVTRAAGGRWAQAFFAAALVALHPVHVQWSTTAETNVAAVTLVLFGIGGALSRARGWPALLMAVGGIGSAAAVRPEMWLAFIPMAPLLLRRSRAAVVVIAGAALSALPGIASRGAFSVHTKGELFQWSNIAANVHAWLSNTNEFGALSGAIMLLAVWGWIRCVRGGRWDAEILLGGATVLIGAFVLFYYPPAGFYSRTMLGAVAPAAILAGLALPNRGTPLWALLAVGGVAAWVGAHREEWSRISDSQLSETKLPELAANYAWPESAVVFAEQPTVLSGLTKARVRPMSEALKGDQSNAFLACDMFCEPHFGGGGDGLACAEALRMLVLEPVAVQNGPHRNYGFYRIVGRSPTPIGQPVCPLVR